MNYNNLNGSTIKNIACLAQFADGSLASGSWDTTIRIWNVTSGLTIKTLNGHTSFVSD